jgi:Lar family restriction alleviation protein
MTEQLKPCPFCGGDVYTIQNLDDGSDNYGTYFVRCTECPANVFSFASEQQAIDKWNTRDPRFVDTSKRIKELEREVQHWKANHACEVERARVLKDRTDMPLERVQAYEQISEMKEQLRRLKSFARDFAAIGKYTGGFISTCYFEKLSKDYQICDDADWLKD